MRALFSKILTPTISVFALCCILACSDDPSSGGNSGEQNNETPIELPPQATANAPISVGGILVEKNGNRTEFAISGGASINSMDTVSIPAGFEAYFTNFTITLAKIVDNQPVKTPLNVTCQGAPCALSNYVQIINFAQLGASIIDNNKSDCGTFRIYTTYYASYDLDQPNLFIRTDSADFVREQQFCEEPKVEEPPASAVVPGENITLTSYQIAVNTKGGEGISLATGSVVPLAQADIYFTSDDLTDEIKLHTANGFKITEYINADDMNDYSDDWTKDMLPPEPARMSNFRFRSNSLSASADFTSYMFYVALGENYNADTGDGFYAFTELDHSVADANHNILVTLLVYKR